MFHFWSGSLDFFVFSPCWVLANQCLHACVALTAVCGSVRLSCLLVGVEGLQWPSLPALGRRQGQGEGSSAGLSTHERMLCWRVRTTHTSQSHTTCMELSSTVSDMQLDASQGTRAWGVLNVKNFLSCGSALKTAVKLSSDLLTFYSSANLAQTSNNKWMFIEEKCRASTIATSRKVKVFVLWVRAGTQLMCNRIHGGEMMTICKP